MKGPTKREEAKRETKDKKLKTKNFFLNSWLDNHEQFTSPDEARAACKTRKRKERQESISSLCQEKKVIRSNSEERPHSRRHLERENIIRRVLSSEDLQKQITTHKKNHNGSKEKSELPETIPSFIDEYEHMKHEKRRYCERFAKPLTLKCKRGHSKRPKGKNFLKVKYKVEDKHVSYENTKVDIEIHANSEISGIKAEKERSPSPLRKSSSPAIDLTTLHQQVDDSDPIPSCSKRVEDDDGSPSLSVVPNRLLSSPRNSIIAAHCIYLDPDAYNSFKETINPNDDKLQNITKQINIVKKKIKKSENEYQLKHGYKPSHLNKMNDNIKKHYLDLMKLKKEYKLLQESGLNTDTISKSKDKTEGSTDNNLMDILFEIEMKLQSDRELSNRSYPLDEMTQDQLLEEKVALQRALLHLQDVYGRPSNRQDRYLALHLYERYRVLKRMICKSTMGSTASNDLQTIHEDETAHFVFDSKSPSETSTETLSMISSLTNSDTDTSENLHAMSTSQLKQQLKKTKEEKKNLKRSIKEYEASVQLKTGRKIQKEEKRPVENLYKNYKTVKSKIKLLEALLAKQN